MEARLKMFKLVFDGGCNKRWKEDWKYDSGIMERKTGSYFWITGGCMIEGSEKKEKDVLNSRTQRRYKLGLP